MDKSQLKSRVKSGTAAASPAVGRVRSPEPPPGLLVRFGFAHWRQIDDFEVGNAGAPWFVSLLERLSELSILTVETVSGELRDGLRVHEIDWDATGIPIQMKDLSHLPPDVKSNPDEFPLVQIHISKGRGRIHGYWDESWHFQVVLLDRFHNLQPSKDYDYKVTPTVAGRCEVASISAKLDAAMALRCGVDGCQKQSKLDKLHGEHFSGTALVVCVTNDVAKVIREVQDATGESVSDLFSFSMLERKDKIKSANAPE